MTEEEYDRMVEHLKSACATCGYGFPRDNRALVRNHQEENVGRGRQVRGVQETKRSEGGQEMVSDEQRREIAANLLSESEAWLETFPDSTLNDEDNDAIMFDISRFVLFEGTPTVGEFYARLADLIERPTCTVVSVIFRDSLDE